MRILLVYKDSNFDLHGPRVASQVDAGRIESAVLKQLRSSHEDHHQTIDRVRTSLKAAGLGWSEINRGDQWPEAEYDWVITIGGDGTVLHSSHFVKGGTRIVGVRSSDASVGYLCARNPQTASDLGAELAEGRLEARPVARLKAVIAIAGESSVTETKPVLNDFLFVNSNPTLTTRYVLRHRGSEQFQRSSGLWISTPVGSTAGIRAGGGQRQNYASQDFQFRVREMFRGANENEELIEGGLFSPEKFPLHIDNRSESALLALDGQHQSFKLAYGDQFLIKRAESLQLVISPMLAAGKDGFVDVRQK